MVDLDLFLDEYPQRDLGTLHRPVILHEMFLHATDRGWKETERMCRRGCQSSVREPDPVMDQSALQLIGYHTLQMELRDVYHSIYLLNRAPGFPSCGVAQRRKVIQEILSSLQERLHRWTSPGGMEDFPDDARGLSPPQSYEAALQAACQKMMETAAALQSDLDQLNNESRGRSQTHSQSGSWHMMQSSSWQRGHSQSQHWACSPEQVENQARSPSPDHLQIYLQGKRTHSPDHTQSLSRRWVIFHMPKGEDATTVEEQIAVEPTIEDLETWLEHQAGQLGTPTWWRELEAIPDIKNPHKFARKIRASFYVTEVRSWMNQGQPFSTPPAPRNLNRGAFYPEGLEYQDVRQRPILLTVAYCRCLQHWVEKHYLPISAEACPLARNVRELLQAVDEFMHITARDILEGLDMYQPTKTDQPPFATLFRRVLSPPANRPETMLVSEENPQQDVVLRPWGRACPFP